jgi:hypothetical protein
LFIATFFPLGQRRFAPGFCVEDRGGEIRPATDRLAARLGRLRSDDRQDVGDQIAARPKPAVDLLRGEGERTAFASVESGTGDREAGEMGIRRRVMSRVF